MSYEIFNEDCLEGMKRIPDGSVDMILTDLPYNLTDCAWDKSTIDLAALWAQFKRILKPYCAAVLFASGKFTHKLIASNFEWFKYKWIWVKNAPTDFVNAHNRPMRKFEEILVFTDGVPAHKGKSSKRMKYNPQGLSELFQMRKNGGGGRTTYVTGFQDRLVSTPFGTNTIIKKKNICKSKQAIRATFCIMTRSRRRKNFIPHKSLLTCWSI